MEKINSLSTQRKDLINDIYTKYNKNVYLYVLARIKDKDEAEDLTQDIFLRLMMKGYMIDPHSISSFIFVMARNVVNDYYRMMGKRQRRDDYFSYVSDTEYEDCDAKINIFNILELENQQMEKMSPACKQVYYLSRFKEMSSMEIADAMNIELHSVNNFLYNSRRKMREYIKKIYG